MSPCTHDHTDIRTGAALRCVRDALNGLWTGDMAEERVINDLRSAVALLGGQWEPPDGSDGGYVPSDDDDPKALAKLINDQLAQCSYYDGETVLDGPFKIWARAILWYNPRNPDGTVGNTVLLIKGNRTEQAPVLNALLVWGTTRPSAYLPDYPGPTVGWHFNNISLGSQWVVDVWLTDGGVAVQEQ
ncbi:MAG: hypothetical protein OXQ29_17995 [Rhodospirillaceae bacterium]|nr:hypothetical protein [Rhodospirillaceae bacterium]